MPHAPGQSSLGVSVDRRAFAAFTLQFHATLNFHHLYILLATLPCQRDVDVISPVVTVQRASIC